MSEITKLDMTMMQAVHDALRREAVQLARLTARPGDEPRRLVRAALGWELFKRFLRVHHTSEDELLWPVLRAELADGPGDLALLEAMEAEHAVLDPLLAAVDAALLDEERGPDRLGGAVDALVTALDAHLAHEEAEALPLIDATLREEQWQRFGAGHRDRVGEDASRYLPWLLEGADPGHAAALLERMPPPVLAAYAGEWKDAWSRLVLWPAPAV